MINLAGRKDCDDFIIKEIVEAGLEFNKLPFSTGGEVNSHYYPFIHGWSFSRNWYYWVAKTDCTPLLFKYADELHESHGQDVRVEGHCECPSPREYLNKPWHIGVNFYHVDSQEGLNALVKMIKRQTDERKDV